MAYYNLGIRKYRIKITWWQVKESRAAYEGLIFFGFFSSGFKYIFFNVPTNASIFRFQKVFFLKILTHYI